MNNDPKKPSGFNFNDLSTHFAAYSLKYWNKASTPVPDKKFVAASQDCSAIISELKP